MTKNIAHRGFSALYPENTMLAFEKAVEAGCDGIELDVHLSRDGEIIIIHDEMLERTTNGQGYVKNLFLTELSLLKISNGQHIPTLAEYLDFAQKAKIITNIELKNDIVLYPGIEKKVIAAIRSSKLEERIILSSFNHFSILECKKLAPEISCAFLTYSWYVDVGAYAKGHNIPFVHPTYTSLSEDVVKEIHNKDIGINTYTVNDSTEMARLIALGVEGIITDCPDKLKAELKRANCTKT